MRRYRFAILPLFLAMLFPLSVANAADNPRQPPKVKLKLDTTPMQDAMDQQIEEKKKGHQGTDDDCDQAVKGHNEDNIIKHCKVPKVTKHDAVVTDIQGADHKRRGQRVETETTYECDSPEHCGMTQWPGYAVKPEQLDPDGGDPQNNAAGLHVRRIVTANSTAINNDLDCVDTLTLKHHGGFVRDENGNTLLGQTYPNGHEQSCFDAQGTLKQNLEVIAGGCRHPNGATYETSECQARNYTTLEELKDEDPPASAAEPAYDRDGDGVSGEDGPDIADTAGMFSVAANETPCARKGGVLLEDGSCDFGRMVRLDIKKKMKDHGKGWKIDANGDCDANADGDVECGKEARRITRTEWYALRCPEGAEYVDGRCLVPTPPEELARLRESGDMIAPEMVLASTAEPIASDTAMMGLTWALPKVEWGINEVQEVCIFGFCFEVFALRFGYEFDLAFGLRLPVQVEITPAEGTSAPVQAEIAPNLATPETVLAGEQRTYTAKLTPVDFTVQQYYDFCVTHRLVEKGKIPSCDRFAFADYFWDQILGSSDPSHVQGSEFVAQMVIWAGAELRILMVPIIDWSVGVDFNLPAMCTMWKVYTFQGNPIGLVVDLAKGRDWLTTIDDNMLNCSTFVTPFGYKTSILNPTEKILRTFPFLSGNFTIDADCTIAKAKGWVVSLGSKQVPLCTHLSYYGVGVGLKFVAGAGSTHIGANWSVSGDASPGDHGPVDFYDTEAAGPNAPTIGPVHFDNHDLNTDEAQVKVNDFTYYLDTIQLRIEAVPQILNFSLFSIPVYTLEFEGLDLLSLGQHPGTEPITMTVPVKNYGLKVKAGTAANKEEKTLLVKPGDFGYFQVALRNEGTETDSFGHFVRQLTNRGNQAGAPFQFVMNHNLDFDCTDLGGTVSKYRGNPYDGIADDCYTADGQPRSDRKMLEEEDGAGPGTGPVGSRDEDKDGYADEDPAGDDWVSSPDAPGFHAQSISGVAKHSLSTTTLMLGVKPFLHPLTAPGLYPVSIQADSLGAIAAGLTGDDASGIKRTGAEDIVYVRVDSFFDPKVALSPVEAAVKPGGSATYAVETSNGGNNEDTLQLLRVFGDSNRSSCTLTTLGTLPAGENSGCPYRAVVTMIPAAQWTNIGALAAQFGPLQPLGSGGGQFTIQVPRDWAGMQDTVYDIVFTSQSSMAPVHNDLTLKHKVLATKESMARYLNLEVAEFLAQITAADAQGISARGIQPVMLHPVTMMTTKALEQVLAGELGGASKTLSSAIKVMEAVDRMVQGAALPEPRASDWKARSTAILADMAAAQASTVASLP